VVVNLPLHADLVLLQKPVRALRFAYDILVFEVVEYVLSPGLQLPPVRVDLIDEDEGQVLGVRGKVDALVPRNIGEQEEGLDDPLGEGVA